MDQQSKLQRLIDLVTEYVKYLDYYTEGNVEVINGKVKVTYSKPKTDIYLFQSVEFPMEDLDKRIEHYGNKIKNVKEKLQVTETNNKEL